VPSSEQDTENAHTSATAWLIPSTAVTGPNRLVKARQPDGVGDGTGDGVVRRPPSGGAPDTWRPSALFPTPVRTLDIVITADHADVKQATDEPRWNGTVRFRTSARRMTGSVAQA
jgi:hypothetical protein